MTGAKADHLGIVVHDALRRPVILEIPDQLLADAQAPVALAQQQDAAVRG
jgi:hypothetical protein